MKYAGLILLIGALSLKAQTPTEVLEKAVAYHDPKGEWKELNATFIYRETRPDGTDRSARLEVNNRANWHKLNRNNEEEYEVNGRGEVKVLKGDGDSDRGKLLRNYYVFLWGLPMKLLDKGTPIDPKLDKRKINDQACFGVKVNYEKETYTFYFSQKDFRMIAYQFFKNDESGKGEIIHLDKEIVIGNMRIPKERAWFELPAKKYLGTDILETVE